MFDIRSTIRRPAAAPVIRWIHRLLTGMLCTLSILAASEVARAAEPNESGQGSAQQRKNRDSDASSEPGLPFAVTIGMGLAQDVTDQQTSFFGYYDGQAIGLFSVEASLRPGWQGSFRHVGDIYIAGGRCPCFDFGEWSILYGRVWSNRWGHLSAEAGPSLAVVHTEGRPLPVPADGPGIPHIGLGMGASAYVTPTDFFGVGLEVPASAYWPFGRLAAIFSLKFGRFAR